MKSKLSKKVLSVFLTLLMICSVVPLGTIPASAAYENTYSNTGNQRTDIIGVAKTQIGNTTGSKYTFGAGNVSWCAYFIVWCARQANIGSSIIKTTGWADADDLGVTYYSRGSYTPKSGDIIIFDYVPYSNKTPASSYGDHVGLVEYVEGNYVHTIEGNAGSPNAVRRYSYSLTNSDIKGYGVPNYTGGDPHTHSYTTKYFEAAHPHKTYGQCSCGATQYDGGNTAYASCSTCMATNNAYPKTPIKAYTIATGKTTVYTTVGMNGKAKSNRIYDTDECTIDKIYACGWCKVTFPLDTGGTDSGYVKTSVFFKSEPKITVKAAKQITTYSRSDLTKSVGYAGSGDKIYISGYTSSAVQILYPLTGNTYKAAWIPKSDFTNTFTFNANGGTGTMSTAKASYQNAFTLPANTFTRAGYTFANWSMYRKSDGKWYTNNGWETASSISQNGYTKSIYKSGNTYTLDNSWVRDGTTGDTYVMYANWTPNKLSVYYNANGGTMSSDTYKLSSNVVYVTETNAKYVQTWTYNTVKTSGLTNASTFGLSKTGYTFGGWGTSASGGSVFDQNDASVLPEKINANLKNGSTSSTLYAVWTPNTYSVKYNANGGAGTMANSSHNYDTAKALTANTFTRTGYNFLGWATSSTATTAKYTNKQSVNNLTSTKGGTVNLYAVWAKNAYTVKYNANGGVGTMADSAYTYDTAKALTANTFTRNGYKFLGWSTSSTATTAIYTDKQSVKNLTSANGGTVTLYAVWEKIPVTVTGISIQNMPTKTAYEQNETFSSAGLSIKVNYSDGTSKTVTSGFTVSKPDMATAGTKSVTVTYEGKTASFNITVKEKEVVTDEPQYKITGATVVKGSTFTVNLMIENNPGIVSLRNMISYDENALTLVSVEDKKLLNGYTIPSPVISSPYTLRWTDSLATENNQSSGTIAVLTFEVKDTVALGDYKITVTPVESRNSTGSKIEFKEANATITVTDVVLGDVDNDGEITDWDAILLNRYLAGWKDVTITEAAADVDCDGEISDWDAIMLERYLAGWPVKFG